MFPEHRCSVRPRLCSPLPPSLLQKGGDLLLQPLWHPPRLSSPSRQSVSFRLEHPSRRAPCSTSSATRMLAPDTGINSSLSSTFFTREVFPDFEGPESDTIMLGIETASLSRSSN